MQFLKNMCGKVLSNVANLSPVKRFVKYALDKTLNQLLSNQIKLDNFDKGVLNVSEVDFNVEKINKDFLLSSPYIMHCGSIGNLKICLPGWSEISTKSIEIQASKIQITLKPNKCFYENFKEGMKEKHENSMFYAEEKMLEGEISENGTSDFFKQLLKQIVLNIKVKTENIIIKLFMNEPSKKVDKPQFYLMLRVPSILVGKNEDLSQNKLDVEEIKFNLEVPQISVHLLQQNVKYPEYANEPYTAEEQYPFTYPSVHHPSTILLIGNSKLKNSEDLKSNNTKFILNMKTDYKEKQKEMLINSTIASVEVIINPVQIKILSRFISQINQFKKILDYVIKELGLKDIKNGHLQQSINPNVSLIRRVSTGNTKSNSFDIFTSVIMSMNELPQESNNENLLKSFIRDSQGQKQNEEELKSLNQSIQQIYDETYPTNLSNSNSGFRNIHFKNSTHLNFKLNFFNINILKFTTKQIYEKHWTIDLFKEKQKINTKIGCSHFMVGLKKLIFNFKSKGKISELEIQNFKIYNVKLTNEESSQNKESRQSEQFFEMASSQYYKIPSQALNKPLLREFHLSKKEHYCVEEIFRISRKPSEMYINQKIKRYNFIPHLKIVSEEEISSNKGFTLNFKGEEKQLKIIIQEVSISVNTEVVKDFLNIIFPVFSFRAISENSNVKAQSIEVCQESKTKVQNKSSLDKYLQSQYIFVEDSAEIYEEIQSKQKKIALNIKIQEINFGFRESLPPKQFNNLTDKLQKKTNDSISFDHQCFCKLKRPLFYGEIYKLEVIISMNGMRVKIDKIELGLVEIQNSQIKTENLRSFLTIEEENTEGKLNLFYQKTQEKKSNTQNQERISLFIPTIKINIEQADLLETLEITKNTFSIVDNLITYTKSLKEKMTYLEKINFNLKKADKKVKTQFNKFVEVFVSNVYAKVLFISAFCKSFYFYKSEDEIKIKLDTFAAGLRKKIKSRIGQMKNRVLAVTDYQKTQKYYGILDSNIVIVTDGGLLNVSPFKAGVKAIFFKQREDQKTNIMVFIRKRAVIGQSSEGSSSKNKSFKKSGLKKSGFQFIKNTNKMPSFQEESNQKSIDILIKSEISINAVNALHLMSNQSQLQKIINKAKQMSQELTQNSTKNLISERKDSGESQIDSQQLIINLKPGRINLDLRPQFLMSIEGSDRTFSNLRSMTSLIWNKISLRLNPDTQVYLIDLNIHLEMYFLHHEDRDIEANPLLIKSQDYLTLGFKNILQMRDCELFIDVKKKQNKVQIKAAVHQITISFAISTIALLKLHLEHFTNHCLKKNYGKTYEETDEEFQILDINEDEIMKEEVKKTFIEYDIVDESENMQKYEQQLEEKKRSQLQFKNKQYSIYVPNADIVIKEFKITSIKVKIAKASDFKFISCQSANQSKDTKRLRSQFDDALSYICLFAKNFTFTMQMVENNIETLTNLEQIELYVSSKKSAEGFFNWIAGKRQEEQDLFYLLKKDNLKILFTKNSFGTKIKLNKIDMNIGFTEELLKYVDEIKSSDSCVESTGWRKKYFYKDDFKMKLQQNSSKLLLLMLPLGVVSLTIRYLGKELVSNLSLSIKQLAVHEEERNQVVIANRVTEWIKGTLTTNTGSIIGGLTVQGFSVLIDMILGVVKFFLSFVFPSLKQ